MHPRGGGKGQTKARDSADDALAQFIVTKFASGDIQAAGDCIARNFQGGSVARNSKAFFHSLIQVFAEKHDPQGAAWCIAQMESNGLKPNMRTFNTLLNACAKSGNVQLAEDWWQGMEQRGLLPNNVTYNIMISACAHGRDTKKAEQWLARMLTAGVTPCNVTFGTLIDSYAKMGQLKQAEDAAKRMKERGLKLDGAIYNSLINGCARGKRLHDAEHWLMEMLGEGIQPNEKAFNSLIHTCGKLGDTAQAEKWFDAMLNAGCKADMISYSAMINVSAKADNLTQAELWMDKMLKQGLSPNIICYNTLLHACARTANYNRGLFWMMSILQSGLQPTNVSFNCMVDLAVGAGRQQEAGFYLKSMISSGFDPDDFTISILARSNGYGGNRASKAGDLLLKLPTWAYKAIVGGYEQENKQDCARIWMLRMKDAAEGRQSAHDAPGSSAGGKGSEHGAEGKRKVKLGKGKGSKGGTKSGKGGGSGKPAERSQASEYAGTRFPVNGGFIANAPLATVTHPAPSELSSYSLGKHAQRGQFEGDMKNESTPSKRSGIVAAPPPPLLSMGQVISMSGDDMQSTQCGASGGCGCSTGSSGALLDQSAWSRLSTPDDPAAFDAAQQYSPDWRLGQVSASSFGRLTSPAELSESSHGICLGRLTSSAELSESSHGICVGRLTTPAELSESLLFREGPQWSRLSTPSDLAPDPILQSMPETRLSFSRMTSPVELCEPRQLRLREGQLSRQSSAQGQDGETELCRFQL